MKTLSELALALRKRLPHSLRHILRVVRNIVSTGQPSPAVPQHLLVDCRVCASRHDLVELLPQGERVAEVGTYKGDFALHILAKGNPAELHLIDLDFSETASAVVQSKRVTLHTGLSHD